MHNAATSSHAAFTGSPRDSASQAKLAAQFGFLPGAIWIIVGVAIGGAVQDFVILCASVRRDGKSLGQMAKEEIGPIAGYTALVAVLGIMIVLIAVLALVVVNALKASPWGVVTIGLTIPTALVMGVYMRWVRPHRVLEASAIGLVLLVLALYAGRWVAQNPSLAPAFLPGWLCQSPTRTMSEPRLANCFSSAW